MNKIHIILAIVIIFHLVALIVGYKIQKTTLLISYLNVIAVIGVLVYWINKNLTIQQHYFELREAFALCLEACVLIFALYFIIGFQNTVYIKSVNYVAFGLHLLIAIGLLLFISLFKFNRLF
ncbi:MAG: hypothetical protein ACJAT1_001805 [Marivirga sp.]|jgi:hypothetical protein